MFIHTQPTQTTWSTSTKMCCLLQNPPQSLLCTWLSWSHLGTDVIEAHSCDNWYRKAIWWATTQLLIIITSSTFWSGGLCQLLLVSTMWLTKTSESKHPASDYLIIINSWLLPITSLSISCWSCRCLGTPLQGTGWGGVQDTVSAEFVHVS